MQVTSGAGLWPRVFAVVARAYLRVIMDNYGRHDRDAIMRFLAEIAHAIPASTGAAPRAGY